MHTRDKGKIGEDVSVKFLEKRGFVIVERNYQRKWGEIDIIAIKNSEFHFFEVKSVVLETFIHSVGYHRPEDNVHGLKRRRIGRMIELFMDERGTRWKTDFRFHIVCVFLNMKIRRARVKLIENVIL